jgi:hypothetical protein
MSDEMERYTEVANAMEDWLDQYYMWVVDSAAQQVFKQYGIEKEYLEIRWPMHPADGFVLVGLEMGIANRIREIVSEKIQGVPLVLYYFGISQVQVGRTARPDLPPAGTGDEGNVESTRIFGPDYFSKKAGD